METSDSSDSDGDLELMPPPINDEYYRKSVDEIIGSDSDEEKFENLFDTEYGLEHIDGLFEQTLPSHGEFIHNIDQGF